MVYEALISKANSGEEITLDEILQRTPEAYREKVQKFSKILPPLSLVYLLGITDFYGGIKNSIEAIGRTMPKSLNREPDLKSFYEEQKGLYMIRLSKKTLHSLTALEISLESAYKALTLAPKFGQNRNFGFFG